MQINPEQAAVERTDTGEARILVVDDEEEATKLFARALTVAGYQVCTAHNGEEALQQLEARPFDLLLTDIHMPRMRGDELQRRARERDPDLAVILMTAAPEVSCAIDALKQGAYDYVLKPASLADMVARVGKALEQRKLAQEKQRLERENRDYQLHLERRVAEQADRIRQMLQHSLQALIQALEAKDENTRNHSSRVADLATALAVRLYPQNLGFATKLRVAALFHDIGKIGVAEAVLNKPGKLEPEEMAQIRQHPEIGEAILRPLFAGDAEMLAIVRSHHEQWNGDGYPDGLTGEKTLLGARIVAVADSYDAMTSPRPYRPGMSPSRALQILNEGAGVQWDPQIIEALLAMAEAGEIGDAPAAPVALAALVTASISPSTMPAPPRTGGLAVSRAHRPVISLSGDVDDAAVERLQTQVGALMGRGEHDFILDMGQAGFVRPANVQAIYLLHLRAQQFGGSMVIRDVPDHVLVTFREAGLDQTLCFEQSPIKRPRRPSAYGNDTNRHFREAA